MGDNSVRLGEFTIGLVSHIKRLICFFFSVDFNIEIFSYLEHYEMLKALYDFEATFAKTLSFREGDHFIFHQTNTKQRNWWQVVNNKAQVGYIPSNYVTTVKVCQVFRMFYQILLYITC